MYNIRNNDIIEIEWYYRNANVKRTFSVKFMVLSTYHQLYKLRSKLKEKILVNQWKLNYRSGSNFGFNLHQILNENASLSLLMSLIIKHESIVTTFSGK